MYGHIKGVVTKIHPEFIIVETHGVGYKMISPTPFSYHMGDTVLVYTYLHVREDILALYGFKDEETLTLFQKLISVSGIGPKSALSIVAFEETSRVIDAIERHDAKYLTKFPGIGMKSAQQIILDLKGKLDQEEAHFSLVSSQQQDIMAALSALGYNKQEIGKAIRNINIDQPVSDAVKEALAYLLK